MAKLYAELTSDKGGRVLSKSDNNSINVTFTVKNRIIGSVELYIFDDEKDGCDNDEYLLKYYKDDDDDPIIITQGNL